MENNVNEINQNNSISKKHFAGIGLSVMYIIAYFAMQIVGMVVMIVIAIITGNNINKPGYLTDCFAVCTALSAIMIAVWYYFSYGRKKEESQKLSLKMYAVLVLISMAMYMVSNILVVITSELFEDAGSKYEQLMESMDSGNPIVAFLAVAIMAPLGEECLLRGMVLRTLQKYKFSVAAVIIIQGVMFGIIHFNLVQGIYAIPLGIIYGYVAYKSKSVWPTIFMHFINNAIAQIISSI